MTDRSLLARITSNTGVLAGKPTVRGTRLSVEFLLNLMAHGAAPAEILLEYEGLSAEDLAACLSFASKSVWATALTNPHPNETALLSEASLAEDWNRPEEDAVWSHLQPVQS